MRTNGDAGNASWIIEGLVALDDGGGAAEEDRTAKSGDRVGSWSEKFRGFCGIPFELFLSDQCRRPTSKSCDECPGMGITLACSAFLSRDDLHGVFALYPVISGEGRIHHGEILGQASALADGGKLRPLLYKESLNIRDIELAHDLVASGTLAKVVVEL